MTPGLRILAPGLLTTIQDLGRVGYQHLGVAVSGALDPISLRAANALVGNPPETGALEAAYVGPTFVVEADSMRLAAVGGNATIEVLSDESPSNVTRYPSMRTICVRRGEIVRIGSFSDSAVLYVAIEGGFAIDPVLGSVSTYIRGGFGGANGRALAAGDLVPLVRNAASDREEARLDGWRPSRPPRFRAILGPQADYFSDEAIRRLFDGEYTVRPDSDRMGMRLDGPKLDHVRGFNIVSDGIAPGSIQVPGNGQPVVLLADRQTTGGYPKIATIVSADLPALGRLTIGAKVRFETIAMEAALELRRQMLREIEQIHDKIAAIRESAVDVAPMLRNHNLISGVVDPHGWTI